MDWNKFIFMYKYVACESVKKGTERSEEVRRWGIRENKRNGLKGREPRGHPLQYLAEEFFMFLYQYFIYMALIPSYVFCWAEHICVFNEEF